MLINVLVARCEIDTSFKTAGLIPGKKAPPPPRVRRIAYSLSVFAEHNTTMQPFSSPVVEDTETEYRAIETTLLESARGRWFLAEHGRRARRLDSNLLEDAIRRLQSSLREPPALLGQLKAEIEAVKASLAETRANLMARPTVDESILPTHAILKAAEDIHDIAWSLQANPFDPKGCEEIARNAGKLYAMSQSQASQSRRAVAAANTLDSAASKLEGILESVLHELKVDDAA
jgi:hypothetical protein